MLKLKRLKINKFRHVVPTELVFDDHYNVPLGINGSGKTTLLKLISACLRSDFSGLKSEEFDIEYSCAFEGWVLSWSVTSERISSLEEPEQSVSLKSRRALKHASSPPFKFELLFIAQKPGIPALKVRIRHGELRFSVNGGSEQTSELYGSPREGPFFREALYPIETFLKKERAWPIREADAFPWSSLDAVARCHRFDESLGTLGAITAKWSPDEDAPPGARFQIWYYANEERFGAIFDFIPSSLSKKILFERTQKDANSGVYLFELDDAPPLDSFAKASGLQGGEFMLSNLRAQEEDGRTDYLFGAASFRLRTRSGGSLTESLLSYGQKRLLSFLYYVACNEACVVADELVNGLHHAWIEVCLDAIGERQAFLTSQNPLLLDFLPPTSPEEAERRFIRCVLEEREGRDVMVWRNLTPDEAEELCKQYAVGIQQLSELLRVNGLW